MRILRLQGFIKIREKQKDLPNREIIVDKNILDDYTVNREGRCRFRSAPAMH